MKVTFEHLPDLIVQLAERLDNIEALLRTFDKPPANVEDQLLNIKQASVLINLSTSTIYGLVHNRLIPVCKRGKRLYFSKQDLSLWIREGRKLTRSEVDEAAERHLSANNK